MKVLKSVLQVYAKDLFHRLAYNSEHNVCMISHSYSVKLDYPYIHFSNRYRSEYYVYVSWDEVVIGWAYQITRC